ncbi:MAG: hypothetical protein GX111_11540 [Clostridiales bacterium]|jgi:hypothetical protein|nr:hypothetical protein [Clostridiales bacterium]
MTFSDKLDFLIKLSGTTNKSLGNLLGIHQSQISRMRSGARGLPGNGEYIRIMAEFFASACTQDYQRSALSEALRRPTLKLPIESNVLAVILTKWLMSTATDGGEEAGQILCNYQTLKLHAGSAIPSAAPDNGNTSPSQNMVVYFGDEGKRMAVRSFVDYIQKLKEPLQIDISSDENMGWLVGDAGYAAEIQGYLNQLAAQGCTCRRIVGPISNLDYSYAALSMRWLPFYMTRHVISYYYPRLRDDVYHKTLLVVPGKAAVFSFSIGKRVHSGATYFVTDKSVVAALEEEFEDYLALCVPHMVLHTSSQQPEQFFRVFLEYESIQAPCLQLSNSLSTITMTWYVAKSILSDDHAGYEIFLDTFAKRSAIFKQYLNEFSFTDIICLAEPDEVAAGKVPIEAATIFDGEPRFYSVKTYLMHLRNILWFTEHSPNYHLVIRERSEDGLNIIYIKEGRRALLLRDTDPYSVYEISERNLVASFGELLRRSIPSEVTDAMRRQQNVLQLHELIRRLEAL